MNIEPISAFYDRNYRIIADHPLVDNGRIELDDRPHAKDRICRFCRGSKPNVTFRNTAHAVPEFLGNKSVISMNECDACNTILADRYEDHLSKKCGALRALSQLRGKNGIPTYKNRTEDKAVRIESVGGDLQITITDPTLFESIDPASISFQRRLDMPSQPYIPVLAAMALVKIACSICPYDILPHVQPAIDWLMGVGRIYPQSQHPKIQRFPVLYAVATEQKSEYVGRVLLLCRKTQIPAPYLWCVVACPNLFFQVFVPFCQQDSWTREKTGGQATYAHFPVQEWLDGNVEHHIFDWAATDSVRDTPLVTINVEEGELL